MKLDLRKADLNPGSIPVMRLGDAEHLRKGQFAIALGNPYAQARDGSASASLGIISNVSRRPMPPADDRGIASDDATIHHYGTLVHVDTRLDLGTSGGALVNLDGELIGIVPSGGDVAEVIMSQAPRESFVDGSETFGTATLPDGDYDALLIGADGAELSRIPFTVVVPGAQPTIAAPDPGSRRARAPDHR